MAAASRLSQPRGSSRRLQRKNHALRDQSLHSKIELFSRSEINLHLIVTESHLFLARPTIDRTPDLQNMIISKDPEAPLWGRLLFLYFQSSGELVDRTTF